MKESITLFYYTFTIQTTKFEIKSKIIKFLFKVFQSKQNVFDNNWSEDDSSELILKKFYGTASLKKSSETYEKSM